MIWAYRLIWGRRLWKKRSCMAWNKGWQVAKNVCCRLRGHLPVEDSGKWIEFCLDLNYMKTTEANEFVHETKKEPVWSIWSNLSYPLCLTWFNAATSNICNYIFEKSYFSGKYFLLCFHIRIYHLKLIKHLLFTEKTKKIEFLKVHLSGNVYC